MFFPAVIISATCSGDVIGVMSAAELLQLPEVGRVSAGRCADLVVVRGDPLKDVSLLETGVVFVLRGGRVVRDDLHVRCDT